MPIPETRAELIDLVTSRYDKLRMELQDAGPRAGSLLCVDDWTVKDLLAVRAWWTENVVDWIGRGRAGEVPETPAPGYRWKDTPRLNADIVRQAKRQSYRRVRERLQAGFESVIVTIDELDDAELLDAGVFEWAGSYPIARWISLNTARQYETARKFIRRALRRA